MQSGSFNLAGVLEHAGRYHGQVEIVSRRVEDGTIHRSTYGQALRRSKKLANAIKNLGVRLGDRVATMGWNSNRHFEAWYAIAGQGAVCHTVNPRLFERQIEYTIHHAEDKVLLVDLPFVPLLERLQERLPTIQHFVVLSDKEHMPETSLRNAVDFESLIANESEEFDWPDFPESTPSSLCYTSGTTGDPKGVLYTHRSNLLHAYAINGKDAIGVDGSDAVLLMAPMYHANGWGLIYSCPMVGAKLVLPGAAMDGESICELLASEQITLSAAVPTVWNMVLSHLRDRKQKLPHLREVTSGGSAVPRDMIEAFDRDHGVTVVQGWGMTEMSPLGTTCRLKPFMKSFEYQHQLDILVKQGTPIFGVSMKIVDDERCELPHDGTTFGRLLVKGPWIVRRYYREDRDAVDSDGWFDTGDIATIDEHGYMQITDRAKDLIKSGGEWISSIELENAAMEHHEVGLAAVIGIDHPKWGERPLLVVESVDRSLVSSQELIAFLSTRVAKWWLPDDVVFVDKLPLTATGKVSKLTLREQFRDHKLV